MFVIFDFKINGENVVIFFLFLLFGGVIWDVVEKFNELVDNFEELFGIFQGILIVSVKICLDDFLFMGCILDQEVKKVGVDISQYVVGLIFSLFLMFGMLQNKDLEVQVVGVVIQYFNDFGFLEIMVVLVVFVFMVQIMGMVMIVLQMIFQIFFLGIIVN